MIHDIVLQLLNGLVVGSSLALVASGLALVFGVLDIVNFAQGEYFMLGGYVLYFTLQATGNFALGVLAAFVIIGIAGGALLQLLVWPLLGKSGALPLLATLGLSLILRQLAINQFGGLTRPVMPPIDARVPIENVDYPVFNLVIVAASAAILFGGYVFLKYTKYGIWLRAVAENRPMATGLGVPVPRVYMVAFMLSSGLAAVAGALLAPVTSVYATVGSDVIVNAFIVVVAGGMGNFRGAALIALLLGEVEAIGSIWFRPVEVQVFALALVIVLLIARSRDKLNPPAPATRGVVRSRGAQRLYAALTLLILAVAAIAPMFSDAVASRLATYLIFGLLALSVAIMTSFGRLFNVGVGAIFGVAAYTVAILTNHGTFNPLLLFFAAIAAGLLISVVFGVYANVATGVEYLMLTFLTTLAMSTVPNAATDLTGGDNGLQVKGGLAPSFGLNPLIGNEFYYFVLGVVVLALALAAYLLTAQFGKVAQAIGRNAGRAAAMGYQVPVHRMALTLLSGFVASVAGWLYALNNSFVSQDLLGLGNSLNGVLYALVGGADHAILGSLLGAAGFRFMTESLGRLTAQSSLYIGIALLVVVYVMPNGLLGIIETGLRLMPRRVARPSTSRAPEIGLGR
ncbi:MAG: ABC transporter permease, partial [Chloroflexi bacterium]|nr:ABC transporter permease [Chloroflexota bacterium]